MTAPSILPSFKQRKTSSKRSQGNTSTFGPNNLRAASSLKAPRAPWKATAPAGGFRAEVLLAFGFELVTAIHPPIGGPGCPGDRSGPEFDPHYNRRCPSRFRDDYKMPGLVAR